MVTPQATSAWANYKVATLLLLNETHHMATSFNTRSATVTVTQRLAIPTLNISKSSGQFVIFASVKLTDRPNGQAHFRIDWRHACVKLCVLEWSGVTRTSYLVKLNYFFHHWHNVCTEQNDGLEVSNLIITNCLYWILLSYLPLVTFSFEFIGYFLSQFPIKTKSIVSLKVFYHF